MRVLLTGAAGFVGAHFARLLVADGHTVIAVIRPGSSLWRLHDVVSRLTIIPLDLRQIDHVPDLFHHVTPDICILLAWKGKSGYWPDSLSNIESMEWSLKFIRRVAETGCRRFVVAGSCWEYDLSFGYLAEDTPLKPRDAYGASKVALCSIIEQQGRLAGFEVAWPRLFNVYGPYDEDEDRIVPSIVMALLRNQVASITPGHQVRNYMHVADVASAIWTVARSRVSGPVNIASGAPVSIREIALEIGSIVSRQHLLAFGALQYRENDQMFICGKSDRLQNEVGWLPRFDLQEGLRHTVDWWKQRVSDPEARLKPPSLHPPSGR